MTNDVPGGDNEVAGGGTEGEMEESGGCGGGGGVGDGVGGGVGGGVGAGRKQPLGQSGGKIAAEAARRLHAPSARQLAMQLAMQLARQLVDACGILEARGGRVLRMGGDEWRLGLRLLGRGVRRLRL